MYSNNKKERLERGEKKKNYLNHWMDINVNRREENTNNKKKIELN